MGVCPAGKQMGREDPRLANRWNGVRPTSHSVAFSRMPNGTANFIAPLLTPQGHVRLALDSDAPPLPAGLAQRLIEAFGRGSGHGLLHLGAAEVGSILPPAWAWWRDFAARYVTALCATPEGNAIATPNDQALDALIADAPPMTGVEYMTTEVLTTLWASLDTALPIELVTSKVPLQEFLKARHGTSSDLESGRPGPFQSRGEPERCRGAVRLSRQLHLAHVSVRQSATPAAFEGAGRVLGWNESGTAAFPADARAAHGGAVRTAARDGGIWRDLSPAALAARRCPSIPRRCAEAGGSRHHCACPGDVAGWPSRPLTGQSQHRRTPAGGLGAGQPRGGPQDHIAPESASRRSAAVPAYPFRAASMPGG